MRQFIFLAAATFALATGPAIMAKTATHAKTATSAKTTTAKATGAKAAPKAKVAAKTTTQTKWVKHEAKPATKPAVRSKAVANGHMVTTKTKTGKTITYDCSKAGNKTKAVCKGKG